MTTFFVSGNYVYLEQIFAVKPFFISKSSYKPRPLGQKLSYPSSMSTHLPFFVEVHIPNPRDINAHT